MTRRQFSRQPTPGMTARPSHRLGAGETDPLIEAFKQTYVLERRVLERFRFGDVPAYQPSSRLDGKQLFDTPEEKPKDNQWVKAYTKIQALQPMPPSQFLRLAFRVLRSSAFAIPTIIQLATPKWCQLVLEFAEASKLEVTQQFLSESQRAKSAIIRHQKGGGHTLSLAVYYAIVDDRLELSPLFRYCLAMSSSKQIREVDKTDLYCDRLEKLGKRYEFLAAMDYTLFPDLYDRAWGNALPSGFRVAAFALLEAARGQ